VSRYPLETSFDCAEATTGLYHFFTSLLSRLRDIYRGTFQHNLTTSPRYMEIEDVKKVITRLYNDPVDNSGATDQMLARLYSYLSAVPSDGKGNLHWFCSRADSTTVGVASFLLRLFAYDGNEAETWREHLHKCLLKCCDCIAQFEIIKRTSRTT